MSGHRDVPIAVPSLGEEEWQALRGPIESGWLTQGPKVKEFEEAFAARHRVPHAIATTSCTTALHLALAALGVGPGDEVIVPAFSWVATANAVVYTGATPVFVDVDPVTFNLDDGALAGAVTDRTRVVMPVHLFGLCADVDAIRACVPGGVLVVEDGACAAGADLRGRPAGTLGDAAAFSFHPRKSITTGEGGMVTTADAGVADRARSLRNHGASVSAEDRHVATAPYLLPDFDELGFNYRMSDLQAAIGLVQLTKLDRFVAERETWAARYHELLGDIPWLRLPAIPTESTHAWQAFVTVVEDGAPRTRDEVMQHLHDHGVTTRPGTHAITELGWYRKAFGIEHGAFPIATALEQTTIALPLHNKLVDADVEHVSELLHGR